MRKINNKGVLGGLVTTFIATIVIIIILLLFVLVSGIVEKIGGVAKGTKIASEKDIGIEFDIVYYLNGFQKLVDVRFYLSQGKNLEQAIKEAGYEK